MYLDIKTCCKSKIIYFNFDFQKEEVNNKPGYAWYLFMNY